MTNQTTITAEQMAAFQQAAAQTQGAQAMNQTLTTEQLQQLQQMIQSGQVQVIPDQQEPVSDNGFMGLLDKIGQKVQGKQVQQPQEETPTESFTYEYVEITDLCLPKLTAEEKAKAIELANQIEKLKVSIHERNEKKIVVTDTELKDLDRLIAEFKRTTHETLFGQMRLATRGNKIKAKALIASTETKTIQFIDDTESIAFDVIDNVVDLGKSTLDFTGVAAKGIINIGTTATKGVLKAGFNLFK